MRVLLTGATGFVGNNFLKSAAHYPALRITCAVRQHSSELPGAPEQINYSAIADFLSGKDAPQAVLHLAGKAHDTRQTVDEKPYFETNYELTLQLYNLFLASEAEVFVFVSSIKAVHAGKQQVLNEDDIEPAATAYGRSKRMAEEYILSNLPPHKRVYILRPCLVYGPGVKANMQTLMKFARSGIPYPFAAFENHRSLLSVDNLSYAIRHLMEHPAPVGVYNISDEGTISTNDMVRIFALSGNKKPLLLPIPTKCWKLAAKIGDLLHLPFNTEKLTKLTGSMVVHNHKLLSLPGFKFPVTTAEGLKHSTQH